MIIEADGSADLEAVRTRLARAGARVTAAGAGIETEDPWGTRVRFATAS